MITVAEDLSLRISKGQKVLITSDNAYSEALELVAYMEFRGIVAKLKDFIVTDPILCEKRAVAVSKVVDVLKKDPLVEQEEPGSLLAVLALARVRGKLGTITEKEFNGYWKRWPRGLMKRLDTESEQVCDRQKTDAENWNNRIDQAERFCYVALTRARDKMEKDFAHLLLSEEGNQYCGLFEWWGNERKVKNSKVLVGDFEKKFEKEHGKDCKVISEFFLPSLDDR